MTPPGCLTTRVRQKCLQPIVRCARAHIITSTVEVAANKTKKGHLQM